MIICAAIKITNVTKENEIICGHRHGDCWSVIRKLDTNWKISDKVEGFITHEGEFLNREEALKHAFDCGQLPKTVCWYKEDHNLKELYSEDLY